MEPSQGVASKMTELSQLQTLETTSAALVSHFERLQQTFDALDAGAATAASVLCEWRHVVRLAQELRSGGHDASGASGDACFISFPRDVGGDEG